MKKVIVLGGTGMLGQMVKRFLSNTKEMDIIHTSRKQSSSSIYFDANTGKNGLFQLLIDHGPFDYIINCIGILERNIDIHNPLSIKRAIFINALFPYEISDSALETGARVIHISTDGVFARNAGVCLEKYPCDCADIYGKTKSLGEVDAPQFLNIRCSIIGPNSRTKEGLFEWVCNQEPSIVINGFTDHMWNGVTTLQFAQLCHRLMINNFFDEARREAPVHHFCPNQAVSKYELLCLVKTMFRPDITVKPLKSPEGSISRILDTQYKSLKNLYGHDKIMKVVIDELAAEMNKEQ